MSLAKHASTLGFVFAYVVLNALGAMLIKKQLQSTGEINWGGGKLLLVQFYQLFTSTKVVLGFSIIFASAIAWMVALSRLELSVAYPIAIALNFILVVAGGIIVFNEPFTMSRGLGLLLVLIGLLFLVVPSPG